MKSKLRTVVFVALATAALGAATADSAAALGFRIEGKPFSSPEAFSGATGVSQFRATISGTTMAIECKKGSTAGALESSLTWKDNLTWKECKMTAPGGCKLVGEELHLSTVGKLSLVTEIRNSGGGFGEEVLAFSVERGCAFEGNWSVGGYYECTLPNGASEQARQQETCVLSGGHLSVGGNAGRLSYKEEIELASGKRWSVEP